MNDSFNQEVLTPVLTVVCLGFFVCHLCSSVKMQAYLVPALSQFPLFCLGGECGFCILSVYCL